MKNKRFWLIRPANILLMLISLVLCGILFFADRLLFYIVTPMVLVLVALVGYRLFRIQEDLYKRVSVMGRLITDSQESGLVNFPIPALLLSAVGEIIWYNEGFRSEVLRNEKDIFGYNIEDITKRSASSFLSSQGETVIIEDRFFETFCIKNQDYGDAPVYLLYLVDITALYHEKLHAMRTKPAVMILMIDNYDESIGTEGEGQKIRLLSEVQNALQSFADQTTGFLKRLSHDRYLMVIEKQQLDRMLADRFQILDKIRSFDTEEEIPVTLSIGVSVVGQSLRQAEAEARQALDMALGRGGDQAAVKTEGGYEFFGGFSKGVEKQTRVKTRIVASALAELIRNSGNVLIMGHRFSDLDSIGAAFGMAKACECFGKTAHLVVDPKKSLAPELLRRLSDGGQQYLLLQPDTAAERVTEKTLLIIVDTHIPTLLESPEIYKRCKQVVIIDHHRKMVNHIDNTIIFYHEPSASSASEMVTELVQYLGANCKIPHLAAEALLSGIMLDTRNFVLRTGVRTFEAAAYLRKLGADTVQVRRLFASSMESYQRKNRIMSAAQIYQDCAVSVCDFQSEDLRVVAPQAADELLNINGVKASFVLYAQEGGVNISARSMGEVNVQVLMERLGGGGHHTMAATQLRDIGIEQAKSLLAEAIGLYMKEQNRNN